MVAGIGAPLSAQSPPVRQLGPPTATFAEAFSRVAGLREQSDGRVVVLDGIEARILRIDFRSGEATAVGRTGRGPGEYTLPIALVALAGDTTLAVDMTAGGRALVVTRDGVSPRQLGAVGFEVGTQLFSRPDIQADARGNLYEPVRLTNRDGGRILVAAAEGVRRLDRRTGAQDTLGQVSRVARSPLIRPARASADRQDVGRVAGPPLPFATVDQWAVAPDGRIAIVTVDPFQVVYLLPSGDSVKGPPIQYTPVPVGNAEKEHWREARQQPVATLFYGANRTVTPGRSRPRYVEPSEWPDALPPFLDAALRFGPDGMLWIERAVPAGGPQTFDLVDQRGRVSARLVLPPRTRLVGIGASAVYTVRIDEDDLEYLQRHPVPR